MKKVTYKISSITDEQLGATEYTYYVNFPSVLNYAYTIRATAEGWMHTVHIWQEAGYTVEEVPLT